jgi:hypothetical protein
MVIQTNISGIGTISDTYTLVCTSLNTNKKALAILNCGLNKDKLINN